MDCRMSHRFCLPLALLLALALFSCEDSDDDDDDDAVGALTLSISSHMDGLPQGDFKIEYSFLTAAER